MVANPETLRSGTRAGDDAVAGRSTLDGWLGGLRLKIVAVTGALVAVPALLNGAYDVYSAVLKIPRTESEALNVSLAEKYLHKEPMVVNTLPIKTTLGTADAKFYIYEEGDINVEYGGKTQWFALSKPAPHKAASSGFIAAAYAGPPVSGPIPGNQSKLLSQSATLSQGIVTRSQTYADGTVADVRIDARSGRILGENLRTVPLGTLPSPGSAPRMLRQDTIDLEHLRAASPGR